MVSKMGFTYVMCCGEGSYMRLFDVITDVEAAENTTTDMYRYN